MRKYLESNGQKLQILSIVIFFVMVVGIVTGSIFYIKTGDGRTAVNEHLADIFSVYSGNTDRFEAAKNFFIGSALQCLVIFISAYFKFGVVFTFGTILRKGFTTGFTSAAAVGAYSLKGTLLMAASGAELITGTIILVIFAAISAAYSIEKEKSSKKFLIFFLIFSLSIFCVISLFHGYLSTTFMKWIYPYFN